MDALGDLGIVVVWFVTIGDQEEVLDWGNFNLPTYDFESSLIPLEWQFALLPNGDTPANSKG